MKKALTILIAAVVLVAVLASAGCVTTDTPQTSGETITITDAFGRTVTVPEDPQKIAVSGSGSMRYFVYLDVDADDVILVDYQEGTFSNSDDHRPYGLAHPELKEKERLGTSKGAVDNEVLLSSNAEILFMSASSGSSAEVANEIQEKTGVPVVMFYSGNYATDSEKICDSLLLLAKILGKEERANELISYFEEVEDDLEKRAAAYSGEKPTVYVGGVSHSGAHGLDGTNPNLYSFKVISANNVAAEIGETGSTGYAKVSKEQILAWDADIIFVDLGTLAAAEGGAIYELQNDPSYHELTAVKTGQVYAVNPYTVMGTNHETALANAYYMGKVLYPEQFADINPEKKADEIYSFVVGKPVFTQLKENLDGYSYEKVIFT